MGELHHSKDEAFENAIGKLRELGFHREIKEFREKADPFLDALKKDQLPGNAFIGNFYKSVIAGGLASVGYIKAPAVIKHLIARLEQCLDVVSTGNYDVYIEDHDYTGIPRAFHGKPFVRPEFIDGATFILPSIHDLIGYAHCYWTLAEKGHKDKVDAVVSYIIDERYQQFPQGYGYMSALIDGKRHCYAIGWDALLPGYAGIPREGFDHEGFIHRLELMAHFPTAVKSSWFKAGLKYLEGFKTKEGRYLFSRELLPEKKNSYYVTGAHMGIEENRRAETAIELESTFRMELIRKLSSQH